MTTEDCITELFCRVDDAMQEVTRHRQSHLCPSETVTLGLLFALKASATGLAINSFYRWAEANPRPLFPRMPGRTRLFHTAADLTGDLLGGEPLRFEQDHLTALTKGMGGVVTCWLRGWSTSASRSASEWRRPSAKSPRPWPAVFMRSHRAASS